MHWQLQRDLTRDSVQTAERVVEYLDGILDSLSGAAHTLLPLAGQPCGDVELALREQATRNAYLRSANLFADDMLYCTSLLGEYRERVRITDYTDGRLWLMDGNAVTPDHALLLLRVYQGHRGVVVSVDGDHISSALGLIGSDQHTQLQVGTHWMGRDGKVQRGRPPAASPAGAVLSSARYPFSVHTGSPALPFWQSLLVRYPGLLGLLLLLGLLAGLACRWQLQRVSSPRVELARALAAEEFVPFFQPVVRNGDFRWSGAEVLMRWQHPREGLVRPDLFIPYAEHSGLIVPMTRLLMQRTAAALAPYASLMEDGFHLAINVCAEQCRDLQLLDDCKAFLAHFPAGRVLLTLELTERKLLDPTPATLELFERLHSMGVRIALDDFGTGQSSLSYLRQFNVDYVKIDRSFVSMIGGDALSLHILDTIIELCGKLSVGLVAEGVETEIQRDYLAAHGVDFQQGFLFARPMPLEAFLPALADRPSHRSPPLPPDSPPGMIAG